MSGQHIINPVLRGFNPDPSVVRVGDDFYMATSTFEWFPGVQIHHSRDLIHWELIHRPLDRVSQLDMRGAPDSCGVWAPCLSHHGGKFYLVYTNVKSFDGVWKDSPNYLVTAEHITGPWSEPVFLHSMGFDGSLFHDEDGRKYFISMVVDHRRGKFFGGIILQEFDEGIGKVVGPVHHIWEGTDLGITEGPHLYKKDGYYYLLTAEGGTEYDHAVSLARSEHITGPWEVHPGNPLVSSRYNPDLELQKAGHGDLFQTQDGSWYIAFLVGRPLSTRGRCTLGRETAIQKVRWEKGQWPELSTGGREPLVEVESPDLPIHPFPEWPARDDFDSPALGIHWQSLRVPVSEDWLSLTERPGHLRLKGRESLSSFHHQSLIARRVQHKHVEASTMVEFRPTHFQHLAGLVCYYNSYNYHYLYISTGDGGKTRELQVLSCDRYVLTEALDQPLLIPPAGPVYLRVVFRGASLQFFYALEPDTWVSLGPELDGSILSDDYIQHDSRYRPAFTGAFIGLCCQDLSGHRHPADFDFFEYREIIEAPASGHSR